MVKFHPEAQKSASTALVAGGAGLVGAYLCRLLLEKGSRVICLDNFATGRRENIAQLEGRKGFLLLEHDLNQPIPEDILPVDYVFHLAGLEESLSGTSLGKLFLHSAGTNHLLALAQKAGAKVLLASTPEVFSAAISQSSLRQYFGPTAQAAAHYSHHEAKRFAEALSAQFAREKGLNARIVRLGDVYGPGMNLFRPTKIGQLLAPGVKGLALPVPGGGLERVYPLHAQDAAEGLAAAMFAPGTSGQVFTLAAENLSLFDLAGKIKRQLEPEPDIVFVPGEAEEPFEFIAEEVARSQKRLGWQPKVSLEEGLGQTLLFAQKEQASSFQKTPADKVKVVFEEPTPKKRRLPSGQPAKIGALLLLLVAFLSLPPFVFLASAFWGGIKLSRAEESFLSGQAGRAADEARLARASFSRSRQIVGFFGPAASALGFRQEIIRADKTFGLAVRLADTVSHAAQAAEKGMLAADLVMGRKEGELTQVVSLAQLELSQVDEEIAFLRAESQSFALAKDFAFLGVGRQFSQAEERLFQLEALVEKGQSLLSLAPQALGVGNRRVYLILFQNNMELRPTGGFIGSYGLATFASGRLTDFAVADVYSADGQLKGHVEPPEAIKTYLGEAGWYLRDSNWDPDFPTSAARAAWFLEKETGQVVDGVVGVNLYFVQKILEAVGPVELYDYGEVINRDNLFERAEFHSEANFFPGSTQKKDFLASLATALFEKLRQGDSSLLAKVAQATYLSLEEREVTLYFADAPSQEKLARAGWAGTLLTPVCPGQVPCAPDYLAIFEANVGVNKANYFVNRRIIHELEIEKSGSVSANLTIDYENRSPTKTWPAGRYKNYLRVYLPQGAILEAVKTGGVEIDKEKIEVETKADKISFGFLVEVPIKSSLKVEIAYRPPAKISPSATQTAYLLLFQKQPGTGKTPFFMTVAYPEFFLPLATSGFSQEAGGVLLFSQEVGTDKLFKIDFARI